MFSHRRFFLALLAAAALATPSLRAAAPPAEPLRPAYRTLVAGQWSVRLTAFPTLVGPAVSEFASELTAYLLTQGINPTNRVGLPDLLARSATAPLPAILERADLPFAFAVREWQQQEGQLGRAFRLATAAHDHFRRSAVAADDAMRNHLHDLAAAFAEVSAGLADTAAADADLLRAVAATFDTSATAAAAERCRRHAAAVGDSARQLRQRAADFAALAQSLAPALGQAK